MKNTTVFIAAGIALLAIIFALFNVSPSKPIEQKLPKTLSKYDTDHDGVVSDLEKQLAAAKMTDSIINKVRENIDSDSIECSGCKYFTSALL